jgi:hypothetical protein
MTIDEGGPAFPFEYRNTDHNGTTFHTVPGMTLRQFYAGLAMQGLMANPGLPPGDFTEIALRQADALIAAERKSREEKP